MTSTATRIPTDIAALSVEIVSTCCQKVHPTAAAVPAANRADFVNRQRLSSSHRTATANACKTTCKTMTRCIEADSDATASQARSTNGYTGVRICLAISAGGAKAYSR